MKILHINTHTSKGGAAIVARNIHLQLLKNAFQSRFYAGRGVPDILNNIETLHISNFQFLSNVLIYRLSSIEAPFNTTQWLKLLPELLNWADVIHLHNVHGYYLPTSILKKILEKPVVWTLHDEWIMTGRCTFSSTCQDYRLGCPSCPHLDKYPNTFWDQAIKDFGVRRYLIKTSTVSLVSPSNILYQKLVSENFPKANLQVIPNPVNFQHLYSVHEGIKTKQKLKLEHDKVIFLFVANKIWTFRKGFDILESAIHLVEKGESITLVVIGNYNNQIQKKIQSLPIQVELIGELNDRSEINRYYSVSDFLIVPSREESFGLITIEALSQGCQVICSDIPVFRELTGNNGLFFPVGDFKQLALQIDKVIENKEKYKILDSNVYKIREKFSIQKVVKSYEEVYFRTIQKSHQGSR